MSHRLLPENHAWVAEAQSLREARWLSAKERGYPDSRKESKWRERHALWCEANNVNVNSTRLVGPCPDDLFLHLPRERDLWTKLMLNCQQPAHAVADISQSLDRVKVRHSVLPTITPGGHVIVGEVKRALAPLEKLLIHGLPLHRMELPDSISSAEWESMGGNMMHLQTVGFACLLALSLVDWQGTKYCEWAKHGPQGQRGGAGSSSIATHPKARSAAEKRREDKLRARFGLIRSPQGVRRLANPQCKRTKKNQQKQRRLPKHVASLCGTRWAS